MKPNYIPLAAALMLLFPSASQAQIHQKTTIESAVVFLNGAELTNTARISLPPGESEVAFTDLAGNLDQKKINLSANNNLTVESITFQNNYLINEDHSGHVNMLKDSIDIMNRQRSLVNNKLTVIDEQLSVLQNNRKVGGDNTGLSIAELQHMLDLLSNKMNDYLNGKITIQEQLGKIDEHISRLNQQMNEEQSKGMQARGQLLVKFYAQQATRADVAINYIISDAGWAPSYDVRVEKVNDPVQFYYKANVHQNSGLNWNKVHITLSTGNPDDEADAPVLQPDYLAFYSPATIGNTGGAVMIEGGRVDGTKYIVDGVLTKSTRGINLGDVAVNSTGINTEFKIDLPYSIPSDGQQHTILVKKYELPATYRYYAIPKLDESVFLQAQVTNWEDLNLLPGQTNIYYDGSYVGQGEIDTHLTDDTLSFSLGKDKKIVIKRELDKELRSVKMIGTNVRKTFAYNISIRNTRKEAANIVILDQVPVSKDDNIVVEDIESDKGDLDNSTGYVKWDLALKANETKKLKLSYTVKYSRGKTVTGLQ